MRILSVILLLPLFSSAQVNPVFMSSGTLNYPKVQYSSDGLFGFEQNGKIGYLDKKGNVVIPATYSYDSSVTYQFIPSFYNGYARVVQNKKQGLIDKTGKIVIPIEHESITPYTQFGNFVLLTKTIGGKKNYGVLTVQNKVLVPAEYEDMKFDTSVILLRKALKWGMLDKNGKELLPFEYSSLWYQPSDKVLIAEKDSKYGVVDATGKWLFEKSKSVFTLYNITYGLVSCKVNNKYGYLDLKGNEVVVTKYDYANPFGSNGLAQVYNKASSGTFTTTYNYGYIDKNGNEIIPLKYTTIGSFMNGLVYAKDPETNRFGYMDKTGKWVLKPIYLDAQNFDDFGGAWVKMTDDKYHYINKTGKEIAMMNDKGQSLFLGKEGYSFYENTEYPYVLIDKTGKQIKKIDDVDVLYISSESMTPYKSKATAKYGCVDLEGNKVIPAEYEGFGGFSDGLCKVQKTIDGKLRTGYIDTKGKLVIPFEYTSGGNFNDGWAVVKKDSLYFFIDKTGNLKEPSRKYDNLNDFKSGYTLGLVKGKNNLPSTYYYINKQLKEEFNVSYKEAYGFWDEVAVIKRDKEYELMNKKGEVFKSLGAVDYLNFSVEGMLAVRENKKWGFVNNRGDVIVTPRYDSCGVFKFGYAKVMKNKKWGIIDKSGNEIIEPRYENILPGENGIFMYYDKSWGIIDKTGKILVQPNYLITNSFEKDRAVARFGKSYIIVKSPLAK